MFDYEEIMFPIICVIGVIVSIIAAVAKGKQGADKSRQTRSVEDYVKAKATKQQTDSVKAKSASTGATAMQSATTVGSSIKFSESDHDHFADKVEDYDKIVGSLGEVADEGCIELDGLRLIAHDENYQCEESAQFDLKKVAQAMVYGEILDNPRFKRPFK